MANKNMHLQERPSESNKDRLHFLNWGLHFPYRNEGPLHFKGMTISQLDEQPNTVAQAIKRTDHHHLIPSVPIEFHIPRDHISPVYTDYRRTPDYISE